MAIEILAASVGALLGLGIAESVAHRRRLARIPTRIHVAGTRGKSSVTRLIAAGLRAGGSRDLALLAVSDLVHHWEPRHIVYFGSQTAFCKDLQMVLCFGLIYS